MTTPNPGWTVTTLAVFITLSPNPYNKGRTPADLYRIPLTHAEDVAQADTDLWLHAQQLTTEIAVATDDPEALRVAGALARNICCWRAAAEVLPPGRAARIDEILTAALDWADRILPCPVHNPAP